MSLSLSEAIRTASQDRYAFKRFDAMRVLGEADLDDIEVYRIAPGGEK
ncbi:MAG: hypothetical protein BWZ10_00166 [candidate division BRC1 bacterium ADurb.BinA364]|nr:MAG: hypothetical protein BWZ10_00166 [candidate division BRC1 bacterium ADurb.BinA364]